MRGRIAGRSVALHGYETWDHAAAFEPFAVAGDATQADFDMTVTTAPLAVVPDGTPQGHGKRTAWIVDEDGNGCVFHRQRAFSLRFNRDFSRCALTLREGLADAAVLRYVYTSQCFSYHLLAHGGCSVHSAALEKNGRSILLVGPSGVGKSTLATACQQVDPSVHVLCEDMPAVCFEDGKPIVFGTPFCGDDDRVMNAHAPLDAIVLLRQAAQDRLSVPAVSVAAAMLTEAVPYPVFSAATTGAALDRVQDLYGQVPVMLFENTGTQAAARQLLAAWQQGFGTGRGESHDH